MAGRTTQAATEVVAAPTSASVRATQAATEVVVLPDQEKTRVTQLVVEVIVIVTAGAFRGEPGGGVW